MDRAAQGRAATGRASDGVGDLFVREGRAGEPTHLPRQTRACNALAVTAEGAPGQAPGYQTGRMQGFSDGVFSIAITLLILEIAVPADAEDHLMRALVDQWPSYLAYLVSFSTIGAVWFAHTVITEYLDHADSVLIRLNLLPLFGGLVPPVPDEVAGRVRR